MSASWTFASRPFQNDRPAYAAAAILFLFGAVLLIINLRLFGDYRRQVADTRDEIAALEMRGRRADDKALAARTALGSYRMSALADESRGLARIAAERRFSWTTLLARLERTLPSDVGLAQLTPRFEDSADVWLELDLITRKREAIVRTIAALSRDPVFGRVELKSETRSEEAGAEPFRFQLSSLYRPQETR